MIKLYNTLTRKKEIFKPIKKNVVGMYSCGPTVYDFAHIGNFRTNLLNDFLKRSLVFLGFKINHLMNITDVDDKIIKRVNSEGISLKELTRKYEKIFLEDLESLNVIKANKILRATESIPEMVKIIKKLLEKGFAYKTSDGIYFSISKCKDYGKLAGLKKIEATKSRIISDEYDKSNPRDFALWKFHTEEDKEVFWDAAFGKGRPGWHIECSAMSMKILGEHFDIHTGGMDLIFPHHTNEIAQSESYSGKKFVNYWIHGAFLNMKEGKMSKSLGNIYTLKDLKKKGFSPRDFRYLCLGTHYRKPLEFSFENLESSRNSLERLKNIILELKDDKKTNKKCISEFVKALENDLNLPLGLQILWNLLRDEKAEGKFRTAKKMDEVFALGLFEKREIPEQIKKIAKERENARKEKNWKKSDELREKIYNLGFVIEDVKEGFVLKKR